MGPWVHCCHCSAVVLAFVIARVAITTLAENKIEVMGGKNGEDSSRTLPNRK